MIEKQKTYATSIPRTNRRIRFCEDLLLKAPHLLIGGTTGSGKSTLLDDIVYSVLTTETPSTTKFIWIDPKRVDLVQYKNLPHTIKYVYKNSDILKVLDDLIYNMELRYEDMQARKIKLYDGTRYIVVIDELADLMTTCKKEIVPRIQRIAQMGRASKIMMIACTQCPSRKIIPAEVVVNFDGRVALRCKSRIESTQIIMKKGAEFLPEHGKALYLHSNSKYYELNVPLIPEEEIARVVEYWEKQNPNAEKPEEPKTVSFFGRLFGKTKEV